MKPLVLRGGRVIDPQAGLDGAYDVIVIDGEIDAIEPTGSVTGPEGAETIDCAGMWVVPGLIDPHVHLRDPGFPQKETIISGLRAAAAGGFATVAAMANTNPVNDSPAITRYMLERAREADAARLAPVSAVTAGLAGHQLTDFEAMADAGAHLFSDDGIPIDDEAILTRAFGAASRAGLAISLHEEDRELTGRGACNAGEISKRLGVAGIPIASETRRMRRDLAIAVGSGAPVHIAHVSTAEGLDLIRAARARHANVTCEATPHHFMLDDRTFARLGPDAKMAPPLRSSRDVEAIRAGLADGTIDMIATDHAPHDATSKCRDRFVRHFDGDREAAPLAPEDAEALADAANGVVGLETAVGLAMDLVHHGIIDAARMVTLMSAAPARLLRLDRQGRLSPGAYADITVIDPNCEWKVDPAKFLSLSRNTPFRGRSLRGRTMFTIVAGRVVYSRLAAEA